MPKPRVAKTKEEAEAIPQTEPVEILLAPEGEVIALEVDPKDEKTEKTKKDEPKKIETKKPDPDPDEDIDESDGLRERLAEAKRATQLANDALAAARAQNTTLAKEREDAIGKSAQHQQETEDARYVAILNALHAAEAESQAAQQAWIQAAANDDHAAQAAAQTKISKAAARIERYEEAKETYESQRETRKTEKVETTKPAAPTDPLEQAIVALPDQAKNWLRSHADYVSDPRKNAKLQALHWDVLDEGHPQFSEKYFESLETHLGLRKAAAKTEEQDDEPAPQPRSRVVPSAPPTREGHSPSGKSPSSTRVQLTPEQREAARISGVDEITYAKGVLEMERLKKNGHYQERG